MFKFLLGVAIGVYGRDVIKSINDKKQVLTYKDRLTKAYSVLRYGNTVSAHTSWPFTNKEN
jgi:hypothetical protein